jgi:Zn-finger nucleic acid-binding protein
MDIDICPKCGGMWLDRGEFRIVTAEANVYREVKLKKPYSRPALKKEVKYLKCVRCGKHMNRENFKKISGVLIDRCGNHGVWLDAGELEKIRHFIADGGLDRAQDLAIEKNRQELKDLATTVKDTAFSHRLIHFWNPKRWFFSGW